jgi:hypothetical protein
MVVRHHDRFTCVLQATLAVAPEAAERVALSRSACDAEGRVAATVVDCSAGGIGLHLSVFIPRRCPVRLVVEVPSPSGAVERVRLCARVQRAAMISRAPLYYIGAAFMDDEAGAADSAERLIALVRGAAGGGSHA